MRRVGWFKGHHRAVAKRVCRDRSSLVVSLFGPASFAAAAVVGGMIEDNYRHRDEPVSALAARGSPAAVVMVPGFLTLAAGSLMVAARLRRTRLPAVIAPMMTLAGVATAGAGMARCSDRSCPARYLGDTAATRSDDLHGACSLLLFGLWIAMPLTAALGGRRMRPVDRQRSMAAGLLALGCWMMTRMLHRRHAHRWLGASQRAMLASALGWYPIAAVAATAHDR